MPFSFSKQSQEYELANADENVAGLQDPESSFQRPRNHPYVKILGIITFGLAWTYFVGSASFRAGERHIAAQYQRQNIDVRMVHHTFTYNDSFPQPPTAVVTNIHHDQPWRTLYPEHGPYFNKSATEPERWTFSVFHQLHCVNRLRHGYWKSHTAALEGKPLGEEDHDRMISPEHIRHCLDYLRQSLMCHGDTTLEPDDVGENGAHGFGVQHNCKDWNQLLRNTDKRVLGING